MRDVRARTWATDGVYIRQRGFWYRRQYHSHCECYVEFAATHQVVGVMAFCGTNSCTGNLNNLVTCTGTNSASQTAVIPTGSVAPGHTFNANANNGQGYVVLIWPSVSSATTFSASCSTSSLELDYPYLTLMEVGGGASSAMFDVGSTGYGSNNNPSVSTPALGNANDLIIGSVNQDTASTITKGASFIQFWNDGSFGTELEGMSVTGAAGQTKACNWSFAASETWVGFCFGVKAGS